MTAETKAQVFEALLDSWYSDELVIDGEFGVSTDPGPTASERVAEWAKRYEAAS